MSDCGLDVLFSQTVTPSWSPRTGVNVAARLCRAADRWPRRGWARGLCSSLLGWVGGLLGTAQPRASAELLATFRLQH